MVLDFHHQRPRHKLVHFAFPDTSQTWFGEQLPHLASLVKWSNLQEQFPWAEPCRHDKRGPMRGVHLKPKIISGFKTGLLEKYVPSINLQHPMKRKAWETYFNIKYDHMSRSSWLQRHHWLWPHQKCQQKVLFINDDVPLKFIGMFNKTSTSAQFLWYVL